MKNLIGIFAALLLSVLIGCSGNDRMGAGENLGGDTGNSSASTEQDYNLKQPAATDPEASGGTTLRASTPYSEASKPAIGQNLNPAPFTGGPEQAAQRAARNAGSAADLSANRAMGTVDGPMDLPAAGVGPGMQGPSTSGSFRGPSFSGSGQKSTSGQGIPGPQSSQGATPK